MRKPNDRYGAMAPPLRAPVLSETGVLSPDWTRNIAAIASKAGRSMVWRGAWVQSLRYAINDVVSDAGAIWCALAENTNQEPGTDGHVWDRILASGSGGGGVPPSNEPGAPHNFLTAYNAATGAFSKAQPAEADVTGLVTDLALKAPLASPTFTGDPKAPTPTAGDNDTSIATTAFVTAAVASGVSGVVVPSTEAGASHNFLTAYNAATGAFSKAQPVEGDVVNLVSDLAAKAPLASPALTGTPTAPTAAPGTSTTQIATTAFVEGEIGPGGGGAYFAWGGDGSDGAATFDGSSTVLGLAPSSSTYTLTRDICSTNITVNGGVTVKTANYAIFATGTVTVNGTIHNDGQTASNGQTATSSTGGTGGGVGFRTSSPSQSVGHYNLLIAGVAGTAGGNGGTAAGSVATTATAGTQVLNTPLDGNGSAGASGNSGGKGGTGTSGAGGIVRAGGTGGAAFAGGNWQTGRHAAVAVSGIAWNTTTPHNVQASNAGNGGAPGGGGGGGDTTNAGGGGGGGGGEGGSGGVCAIFANTITVGATGIIRANGGNGGNGGGGRTQTAGNVGGGGGGAGGSGGVGGIVWLVYHRYTNSGTVQALGGPGGTGGTKGNPNGTGTNDATNGADGPTGPAGNVVAIPC